jgi:hypothetical protein
VGDQLDGRAERRRSSSLQPWLGLGHSAETTPPTDGLGGRRTAGHATRFRRCSTPRRGAPAGAPPARRCALEMKGGRKRGGPATAISAYQEYLRGWLARDLGLRLNFYSCSSEIGPTPAGRAVGTSSIQPHFYGHRQAMPGRGDCENGVSPRPVSDCGAPPRPHGRWRDMRTALKTCRTLSPADPI